MIVSHENKGAILEAAAGECINDSHHTSATHAFPGLDRSDGFLVCQAEPCSSISLVLLQTRFIHTFKSPENIESTILAGLSFVNPAGVTESSCVLLVAKVKWHKRVEVVDLGRECRI